MAASVPGNTNINLNLAFGSSYDIMASILSIILQAPPLSWTNTSLCYRDVMLDGGFAVDAAVAGMFCNGVFTSQSAGLGGGFMMTLHQASTGKTFTLNAREAAPSLAGRDMFGSCQESSALILVLISILRHKHKYHRETAEG